MEYNKYRRTLITLGSSIAGMIDANGYEYVAKIFKRMPVSRYGMMALRKYKLLLDQESEVSHGLWASVAKWIKRYFIRWK